MTPEEVPYVVESWVIEAALRIARTWPRGLDAQWDLVKQFFAEAESRGEAKGRAEERNAVVQYILSVSSSDLAKALAREIESGAHRAEKKAPAK